MKKLVIIALVAISGLEAKNHKASVAMSDSGVVGVLDRNGRDVETMHVNNGDKIILIGSELQAVEQATQNINVGPQDRGGLFSVAAFDEDILQAQKKGKKGVEFTAVNDTNAPITTTLMIKASRMVQPSKYMGKTKRTGGQHITVVIHPK